MGSRRNSHNVETVVKLAKSRLVISPDLWFSLIIKADGTTTIFIHAPDTFWPSGGV